ncbi:MAG TPA: TetR/AcrR family transcriptional regulator [Trebonia sp.]|jgi:AcrR family transcriptional regulator|nr:TetR/AcrR family transcriptional regulator [Trebonia sp.]
MVATTPAAGRRPGGRSARVRDAVYSAVGQLVGEGHRDTMTIPQVAERAGVNPTSIYRRWGGIEALLEEVAVSALSQGEPLPDTGTIAGDLRAWAEIIAEDIQRPQRLTYLRALAYSREGLVASCPCWDLRVGQAAAITGRARERDERVPAVRQVLDHVIAPLYHHAVFGLIGGREYAMTLVDDLLAMSR